MSYATDRRREIVIEMLLAAYPDGITTPQIAERLSDVTRQTIKNDIDYFLVSGIPVTDEDTQKYHWYINPEEYIGNPLRLMPTQVWMLYLPLRRMIRANQHQPMAAYTLLQRLASQIDPAIGEQLLPEIAHEKTSDDDVFRTLTDSWRTQTWVDIVYKPPNKAETRHRIAPYWFEPAVWSDSAYVICDLVAYDGQLQSATLKLDRVRKATARSETFERPNAQTILDALKNTWGIWMGDEPQQVQLRFANRQRQRLMETRWHPTEKLSDETNGSVLWEALVAEPREMLSWIRGWGSDVEVLAPQSIRDEIAREAERTAKLYGNYSDKANSFLGLRKKK